jgi:hypothetical protein
MKTFVVRDNNFRSGREWWYIGNYPANGNYLWKYTKTWRHGLNNGHREYELTYFNSRRHAIQVLKEVEGKNIKIVG